MRLGPGNASRTRPLRWLRLIESGNATNISAIAKTENVDRSYISRMINLTTLAPDIQAAILDESLPDHASLFELASDTPFSWEEQRGLVTRTGPFIQSPWSPATAVTVEP